MNASSNLSFYSEFETFLPKYSQLTLKQANIFNFWDPAAPIRFEENGKTTLLLGICTQMPN